MFPSTSSWWRRLLLGVGACAACTGPPAPAGRSADTHAPDGVELDRVTVETTVEPERVAAGAVATVRCQVSADGGGQLQVPTAITVAPDPGSVVVGTDGVELRPTTVGFYVVRCRTLDSGVEDPEGVVLTVAAAAPASAQTRLASAVVPAGEPVGVSCQAFDRYGNEAEEAVATDLQVSSDALVVEELRRGHFSVYGVAVGDFEVGCRYADAVDATPDVLTVLPGPAARADVAVSPAVVQPTESVAVRCTVTDAYGNPVAGVETTVMAVSDAGWAAADAGMRITSDSFRAERAGLYWIFCAAVGQQAGSESPAAVTVEPGLPMSWEAVLHEQDCYWQRIALPLTYVVHDFWGNEIPDAELLADSVPSHGVRVDGPGRIVVEAEADYDLVVTVGGPHHPDGDLPPLQASIRVDSTPPILTISSPSRAEILQSGDFDDAVVSIEGEAIDGLSDVVELFVDGQPIALQAEARAAAFAVSGVSRWGLSMVTAQARDACGNQVIRAQSYLRSPEYFPAATEPDEAARVDEGLVVHLSQEAFDDRDRTDVDDIATFGGLALRSLDWQTLIPAGALLVDRQMNRPCDGFWGHPEYSFQLVRRPSDDVAMVEPSIDRLTIRDEGLEFALSISEIALPLDVQDLRSHSCEFWIPSSISLGSHQVWVRATRARAEGILALRSRNGQAEASMEAIDVVVSGLELDFLCPDWIDWACDAVGSLVVLFAKGSLTGALEDGLRAQLPPIISGLLSSFSFATPLALPPPLSANVSLECGIEHLALSGAEGGFVEVGLFTQLFPNERVDRVDAASGAIRKNGTFPGFAPLDDGHAFGFALKDDLINQLLWAIWYGGGLHHPQPTDGIAEGTLDRELGAVQLAVAAGAPPVVMPGRGAHPVDIGLGDLYVDATVDLGALLQVPSAPPEPLRVGLYLSAIVGAALGIDGEHGRLTVELEPEPTLHVDIVEIDDPAYQSVVSELLTRLLRLVVPQMLGQALGSIPLDDLDLGPLPGTERRLVLRLHSGVLERSAAQDYYRMTGRLVQTE